MVRKSSFRLVAFSAVVALMAHGAPAQAQCAPIGTTTGTTMGNNTAYKNVPDATKCKLTGFNNVVECNPGGAPPTMTGATLGSGYLTATAAPTAINPYCKWKCYCPTPMGAPSGNTVKVTISGPDGGLPVELMDFAVEDGAGSEEAASESGKDGKG